MAALGFTRSMLHLRDTEELYLKRIPSCYEPHPLIVSASLALALTGLTVIVVLLRFIVRWRFFRRFYSDDYIMLFATMLQISDAVLFEVQTVKLLRWNSLMEEEDMNIPLINKLAVEGIGLINANVGVSVVVPVVGRVAGALMLARIYGTVTWFKRYLLVLATAQLLVTFVWIFLYFLMYRPIAALWNPSLAPDATRVVPYLLEQVFLHLSIVLGAIADLSFVFIPTYLTWNLLEKASFLRRVGLSCICLLSLFTAATVLIQPFSWRAPEDSWLVRYSMSFPSFEQCFVIIVGSLPALLPLARSNVSIVRKIRSCLSLKEGSNPDMHELQQHGLARVSHDKDSAYLRCEEQGDLALQTQTTKEGSMASSKEGYRY